MTSGTDPIVYAGYTRDQLDGEYDNVRKVPGFDFKSYLAGLDEGNRSARRAYGDALAADLRYGGSPEETLDLFMVNPGGPLHVFYHGGYWRMLHKDDFTYIAHGILPHGHNLAIVNYALIPAVRMGELVDQCERALRWLMLHAATYGFDPDRISVSGHSAGGHLAAMMATRRFPHPLASICAMSGIFDLAPIQRCFLNDVLALSDEEVQDYSPLRHAPLFHGPLHILTGGEEGVEYERQARELRQAWSAHRAPPLLTLAGGHDHFTLRAALGDPDSDVTKLALFLSKTSN